MRFDWLVCAAAFVSMMGCGGTGANPVAPSPDASENTAAADSESVTGNTDWQLLDDTVLKVSVDPPASADVKLQASRRYDTEAHAPLKSLHYRIVTDADPNAEWVVLEEPTKKDLGDGMFDSIYVSSVSLPQGNVEIQFKVDQGFGDPYELKDWTFEVK